MLWSTAHNLDSPNQICFHFSLSREQACANCDHIQTTHVDKTSIIIVYHTKLDDWRAKEATLTASIVQLDTFPTLSTFGYFDTHITLTVMIKIINYGRSPL